MDGFIYYEFVYIVLFDGNFIEFVEGWIVYFV